jgi:hypothetical protein
LRSIRAMAWRKDASRASRTEGRAFEG